MIDVIIPAWTETLDHLGEALLSATALDHPYVTVIFNGPDAAAVSTQWFEDESWDDILGSHAFGFASDSWIRDLGGGCYQCHARNWGLAQGHAEYVAFLDADDFFLPGIAQVYEAAQGHRGAWGGAITAWADGSREERRLAGPPTMTIPHHGCYVLRRDVCPQFDVWAPHQVPNRGMPYGYRFWHDVGDDDLVMVDVDALVYRHEWSERQAAKRYWANAGFLGEGRKWPTA